MLVSVVNIPQQGDVAKWSDLNNIKLHDLDADVDLLIGTDAAKVMESWELINSQSGGPYAFRTRVGWVINGPLGGEKQQWSEDWLLCCYSQSYFCGTSGRDAHQTV